MEIFKKEICIFSRSRVFFGKNCHQSTVHLENSFFFVWFPKKIDIIFQKPTEFQTVGCGQSDKLNAVIFWAFATFFRFNNIEFLPLKKSELISWREIGSRCFLVQFYNRALKKPSERKVLVLFRCYQLHHIWCLFWIMTQAMIKSLKLLVLFYFLSVVNGKLKYVWLIALECIFGCSHYGREERKDLPARGHLKQYEKKVKTSKENRWTFNLITSTFFSVVFSRVCEARAEQDGGQVDVLFSTQHVTFINLNDCCSTF